MARGKRVEIVKITVDDVEVDAKACTKCGEVKALGDFHIKSTAISGRRSHCKICVRRSGSREFTYWTKKTYKEQIEKITQKEYLLVDDYKGSRVKVEHFHINCRKKWHVRPVDFLSGNRCPSCAESRGERALRNYLNERKYVHKPQYRFEDCRNRKPLPFDFAVFLDEESPPILIEYDGEQHFYPVNFGGIDDATALKRHRQTVRNDRIKTDYCRANGIPLIRINYEQFDEIEAILDRRLAPYLTDKSGNCPLEMSAV